MVKYCHYFINLIVENIINHQQLKKAEMKAGCKAAIPLIIGGIPFGILFGTLAPTSGLSVWATMAMSLFVFAGSAQFIVLALIAVQAPLEIILLTTFVVNLRHLLYATALVPRVAHLPIASPVFETPLGNPARHLLCRTTHPRGRTR